MENLYIWFYTTARKHKGVPYIIENRSLSDVFTAKKDEGMGKWSDYNPTKDGFPPRDSRLKFPKDLFFIVQKEKEILLDFMPYHNNLMIISDVFLDYLKEQKIDLNFEIANLKVVHRNGLELKVDKKYFAIRIGKFDDELFDLDQQSKKRAAGSRDFFLYPNLKLKIKNIERDLFFLNELWYSEALILTEKGKEEVKKRFYSPEIYKAEDYPLAFNNQLNINYLPEIQ
ncbi:Imm43 family immunity protein [Flavobacterium ardleyense]|uniref:Imm43 family immunity protein n=1 Tax=Flavobacterium ardleyense TaxID=2038737 RepID=A0ABW5Z8Y0_9FLAO